MKRTPRPCAAGDRVRLLERPRWDQEPTGESLVTVERCYWDAWLYGGEWRIFGHADHDPERLRMYYCARDLADRTPDLLDLLAEVS